MIKSQIWNVFYVHENCKFLIFKFYKVMQQHTKGVVGILLLVLLKIYCSLQQWKNFANLSTVDKVIAKINRVSAFLDHPVLHNLTLNRISLHLFTCPLERLEVAILSYTQCPWSRILWVVDSESQYLKAWNISASTIVGHARRRMQPLTPHPARKRVAQFHADAALT